MVYGNDCAEIAGPINWSTCIGSAAAQLGKPGLTMPYLLGMDEAGYGPNLGPLLITCTVWQVPDSLFGEDLYTVFKDSVQASATTTDRTRIPVGDSKILYKSGGPLGGLECGVLAALSTWASLPGHWRGMWGLLDPGSASALEAIPWYASYDCDLPVAGDKALIGHLAQAFQQAQLQVDVRLSAVRSLALFPEAFNRLVAEWAGKGAVLSIKTLELLRTMLALADDEPILVQCDKHGGRKRYGPLLQQAFPEYLVEVCEETASSSRYRWGPVNRRVEVRFVAKGEGFLPTALASMCSKYLRELAMLAFNDFWRSHVQQLRPTAGYPLDARRFRREIAEAQDRLGIPNEILWRNL
jgi:ribonuclease HII